MITQTDKFYKDFVYIIRRKFKISPSVFEPPIEDLYSQTLSVQWEKNNQKYQVDIRKENLGPARLKDAIELFDLEIQQKYPEMLL